MRISNLQLHRSHQQSIADRYADFARMQEQVSTGKRIQRPSDDPAASSQILKSRSLKSSLERYSANLETADRSLKQNENVVSEISEIFKKAYQLNVSGASSAVSQTARNGMAAEVAELQRRFVELANSRGTNGEYLFAGTMNDAQPYTVGSGTLTYNGDNGALRVETGPGETMQVNIEGGDTFVEAYEALENLRMSLQGGNVGDLSGVQLPAIQSQMDEWSAVRGDLGYKMNRVDALTSSHTRRIDDLTTSISDLEDVDLAQALSDLSLAQVAYQASLQAASTSFRLSLMDYLQ